jgi:hypothetical protein
MMQSVQGHTKCDPNRQSDMTREDLLRDVNNGSLEDEELQTRILAVWAADRGSFAHKRAINNLVKYAGQVFKKQFIFNKKWKNYSQEADPVYSRDVEFDALVYLSLHIDDEFDIEPGKQPKTSLKYWLEEFETKGGKSIKTSLKYWIEFNVINKGIDKYRSQSRKDLDPVSLDIGFKGRDKEENIRWEPGDDRLEGLAAILSKLDDNTCIEYLKYIKTDPYGSMKACAMIEYPQVDCFTLVELLYLREPTLNQTQAAIELGLGENHQGLRSHWKRRCVPLLKEIVRETAKNQGNEID